MNKIFVSPTNFESTSLLLVAGDDLFLTRISPERVLIILIIIIRLMIWSKVTLTIPYWLPQSF